MGKSETTRLTILRTAERLFAERGIDGVSLREIAAEAGQRNHSAALYHFGDKRQLLEALLHRHSGPIDDALVAGLDALRTRKRERLEDLVRLLVEPLVAKLDDDDGGASYLRICAELVNSRSFPITSLRSANGPGAVELRSRLLANMETVSPAMLPLRMLRTAAVLFCSLDAYQQLRAAGLHVPRADFEADLVVSLVAMFRPEPRRATPRKKA